MIRPLIAVLLIAAGCSSIGPLKADGGRVDLGCANGNGSVVLPVKVVDVNGNPVANATVTATNRNTGKSLTGTTDGNGKTSGVTEDIGAGDCQLTATEGGRTSASFSVLWTCGECDCVADPASAILTVQ